MPCFAPRLRNFGKRVGENFRIFPDAPARLRTPHYSPPKAKSLRNCGIVSRVIHSDLPSMVTNSGKSGKETSRAQLSATGRDRKPGVAVIGAGRLGTALSQALNKAGYPVEIVVARRQTSARRAAKLIGKKTFGLSGQQLNRPSLSQTAWLSRCALILISTPDDAIASVAEQLAVLFNSRDVKSRRASARRVALHTSGALSAAVLSPLRRAGFAIGSLHPLVSISDSRAGAAAFRGAFFAIEGERPAARAAKAVVGSLGGQSFSISPGAKALYHAAAVTTSGHVVALFDIALEMLVNCGLSRRRSRQILRPLLESTARNLATKDPRLALTGTFARGDVATARRHLAAIKSHKLPDALAAYILLGHRSLLLARERRAPSSGLDEIAEILAPDVKKLLRDVKSSSKR
jgi:predicted short-subunit dehydrogenase-like oxidoreductase (DUF2520 family)